MLNKNYPRSPDSPHSPMSERATLNDFRLTLLIPQPKRPDIPESLPPNVEKALSDAEECAIGKIDYACGAVMGYRKTIERALNDKHPDEKGTLYIRIKKLAKEGYYPRAMIDWLDTVRVLGNEGAHGSDYDPTKEDVDDAREFTNVFLTYVYSLPARVAAARERRESRK